MIAFLKETLFRTTDEHLHITDILIAAAIVVAAFASIWACSRVIALFRNADDFDDSGIDRRRSRAENLARTREGWLGGDLWHDSITRRHIHNYWRCH